MPDDIDAMIDLLKSEQEEALRREITALKLKEAQVLLAEKDAALTTRLNSAKHAKMGSFSKTQLAGKVIKGIGNVVWNTAKAIHKENVQTRRMEARAIASRRRRISDEELR